jgi:hypothetical protein
MNEIEKKNSRLYQMDQERNEYILVKIKIIPRTVNIQNYQRKWKEHELNECKENTKTNFTL